MPRRAVLVATAILLLATAACGRQAARSTAPAVPVPTAGDGERFEPPAAGDGVERRLAAGTAHRYAFDLAAGDFLQVAVEQRGVDVILSLERPATTDPGGAPALQVDAPINDRGTEHLFAVAASAGAHVLEVRAFPTVAAETAAQTAPRQAAEPAGSYVLQVVARRPADDADRARAAAAATFAAAEAAWWRGDGTGAANLYRRALDAQHAAGDRFAEAETHDRLGRLYRDGGERRLAIEHHAAAADLFAAAGDHQREAVSRTHRASTLLDLGQVDAARAGYEAALPLARQAGDHAAEAVAHHGLAAVFQARGEPAAALAAYRRALACDVGGATRAALLHDSGLLLATLGDHAGARRRFEEAAELRRRLGDERGWAQTLQQLAYVDLWLGDAATATAALRRALDLHRAHGDRRAEALALCDLALAARGRGEPAAARPLYRAARDLYRELEEPWGEALAERGLAVVGLELGKEGGAGGTGAQEEAGASSAARGHAERALALYRRLGDPEGEASALAALAAVEGAAAGEDGDLSPALAAAQRAVEISEELRRRTPGVGGAGLAAAAGRDLRATYQAGVRGRYELWIDLLMAAHRRDPAAGHAAHAFEVGERARARSLLDLLTASTGGGDADGYQADPVVPAAEVRRRLLADGSVLLVYTLGAERSWLWRLDRDSLAAWELPPRRQVHAVARHAVELLRRSHRPEARAALGPALCDASRLLLAPALGAAGDGHRLVVVGEGILHFLPFAALPDPAAGDCATAPPLVEGHEVVVLPSVASLDLLRRRRAGRPPAAGLLAAVADPVFGADDPRLAGVAVQVAGRSDDDDSAARLPRLPASRREAEAAVAAAGSGHRSSGAILLALGFDASEDLFTSGRLAGYRVVHLATHARVDGTPLEGEHAERSGIALSRFDAAGRRRDGFLDSAEIHRLDLPAELVVLSGCRTALGRRVAGEGLVGFSRGFFDAGASRLLVTLWAADDGAAAELMARFYAHLFADRLPPAAALRAAQRELRREERWQAPYYWAGFELVGEWRGWREEAG